MNSVEYVIEVLSRWTLVLWKGVGKVLYELCVFLKLRKQGLDCEFIVVRHFYGHHLVLAQQLLLAA